MRKGVIIIEKTDDVDEDALMETALEAGAEDIITHDDSFEIQTAPERRILMYMELLLMRVMISLILMLNSFRLWKLLQKMRMI